MRRVVSNQRGMTLAEVMVALPIITIGLLALLSAIPLSTYATQEGRQTSTATFLANQRLEQVRNARWSATCQVDGTTGLVVPGAAVVTDTLGVSSPSTDSPEGPERRGDVRRRKLAGFSLMLPTRDRCASATRRPGPRPAMRPET